MGLNHSEIFPHDVQLAMNQQYDNNGIVPPCNQNTAKTNYAEGLLIHIKTMDRWDLD